MPLRDLLPWPLMAALAWVPALLWAQPADAERSCDPAAIDTALSNSPICPGDHVNLSVIATGDILGYSWEGPGTGTFFSFSPNYSFPFPILGEYTVIVYGECGNDTAVVAITAQGAGAGHDDTLHVCDNGPPRALEMSLGPHAAGGAWGFNELPHSGIYDPAIDLPGDYVYTAPFPATCPGTSQTATITVVETAVGRDTAITICESDSAFDLMGALAPGVASGGEWNRYVFISLVPHSGIYEPGIDSSGTFRYSVRGCFALVMITEDPLLPWFEDVDNDGFGDPLVMEWSCEHVPGYVADSTDNCIGVVGKVGEPCDDGLSETVDDMITDSCTCAGSLITGIRSPQDLLLPFSIWPNPNAGESLLLRTAEIGRGEVEVFDAMGRLHFSMGAMLSPEPLSIDLGERLAKGLYVVRVTANGRRGTVPLMIR